MASGSVSLQSRFQGTILGAVFGDCLGAEHERIWADVPNGMVVKYFESVVEKVRKQKKSKEPPEKGFVLYTDDSCMTFDLGLSLVKYKGFIPQDVAKNFGETYFASTAQRYYGANVGFIFRKNKLNDYQTPFVAAAEQFGGSGSYGNGSAMRVSPVPLFHHKDKTKITALATEQSKLTHTNPKGINGAILQALAIEKALTTDIQDPVAFSKELLAELKDLTPAKEDLDVYEDKMKSVIKLLKSKKEVTAEKIFEAEIQTDVTAHEAVPAAIFCFLYTLNKKNIPELSKYNGLVRAVIFASAVSLDSDTVASMAGAIAGAYYGVEMIPPEWVEACEGSEKALKLADDLYKINTESTS